jgi:hypothetical protein
MAAQRQVQTHGQPFARGQATIDMVTGMLFG